MCFLDDGVDGWTVFVLCGVQHVVSGDCLCKVLLLILAEKIHKRGFHRVLHTLQVKQNAQVELTLGKPMQIDLSNVIIHGSAPGTTPIQC
jgi:hypothetical protein